MNPISAFFVRNIIAVFFFYGLAFFVMGLALALASRQTSQFRFVQAIRPLAAFGILHGSHEWFEMFQKMATLTAGHPPTFLEEIIRLIILGLSFSMLLLFGVTLLSHARTGRWQKYGPILGMMGVGAVALWIVTVRFRPPTGEIVALADVLIRYGLGIPGALLGTWALMRQQRTFREQNMPQFGRDLVWCAAALFLYGVVGQLFVRPTMLPPTTILNSTLFLQWFGIPVQLFRGVMAVVLTFYMIRALRAFELENRQRLELANQAKLLAQAAALEAERRLNQEAQRRGKLLGELLHQVVSAQESERQRIARELHDATGYNTTTGQFVMAGVTCEACHGPYRAEHPQESMEIATSAEMCGNCHPSTLFEWQSSRHGAVGVTCINCHEVHTQQTRAAASTNELCAACHRDHLQNKPHTVHNKTEVGCIDCHLARPQDDGSGAINGHAVTGHSFEVFVKTCTDCHTAAVSGVFHQEIGD